MVENAFSFNGVSSADFHMLVSGYGTYDAPQRDITMLTVAGRSGDLTLDNGRFENVDVTYKAAFYSGLNENYKAFNAYMANQKGYKRLEDTFHNDEYRLGVYKGGLNPKLKGYDMASVEIKFNCKPQRYLKAGDETLTFTQTGTLYNPTAFEARPLIRLYGSGTLTVNGVELTVTDIEAGDYIDIDSEMMDAFKGTTNLNAKISGEFPVLKSGENTITYSGDFEIKPRWYVL